MTKTRARPTLDAAASAGETDDGEARTLADDLRQAVSAFVRAVRHDTGTIKSAQSEALDLLWRLGPANVATLSAKRGVTHQTMRLVIAELEARGLVRQGADPADRRSRLISISDRGTEALFREQEERTSNIERSIKDRLTFDEREQLRAAVIVLQRLAKPTE